MNNNGLLKKVKETLEKQKKYEGHKVFTIATTSKIEAGSFLTPFRVFEKSSSFGVIIFDEEILLELIKIVDGSVDIILVDTEKKIPFNVSKKITQDIDIKNILIGNVRIGNLSKICFQLVKKSQIFEFKPNDLTVNSTWNFVSQKFQFISGMKISIIGAGNIGSKLALKFVESGAEVHIFRRDYQKGREIASALNLIKPPGTIANIFNHESILQCTFKSDVVIGTSSGIQVIDEISLQAAKKNCLVIDLGKNNLTAKALKIAQKMNLEIYRVDVGNSIESYIQEVLNMNKILNHSYGRRDMDICNLVSNGRYGFNGDVVVDNINNPTQIFGISDGKGSIKIKINKIDDKKIKYLHKKFKIDF